MAVDAAYGLCMVMIVFDNVSACKYMIIAKSLQFVVSFKKHAALIKLLL